MNQEAMNNMQKKIMVIHQPVFFPTLKVLNKIVSGDEFIVLDNVQFVRNDVHNRIKIRNFSNPNDTFWITASVKKGSSRKRNNEIEFYSYKDFSDRFRKVVYMTYFKSPYYYFIEEYLDKCFSKKYIKLNDFNTHCLFTLFQMLNIEVIYRFAGSTCLEAGYTGDDRLIALTKHYNATSYLSGSGGKNYIDPKKFTTNGIELLWHQWEEPENSTGIDWYEVSFIDYIARQGSGALGKYISQKRILPT